MSESPNFPRAFQRHRNRRERCPHAKVRARGIAVQLLAGKTKSMHAVEYACRLLCAGWAGKQQGRKFEIPYMLSNLIFHAYGDGDNPLRCMRKGRAATIKPQQPLPPARKKIPEEAGRLDGAWNVVSRAVFACINISTRDTRLH